MRKLENHTFNIAVLNDSLFILKQTDDGVLIGQGGLNYLLLECLAFLLGFRYRLVVPPDKEYGLLSSSGTWNGIMRMLVHDEADFTASNLYVTPERETAVNFSLTCNRDDIVHITKADSESCGGERVFVMQPFQSQLWVLFFFIFLSLLLLQLSIRLWFSKHFEYVKAFALWNIFSYTVGIGNPRNLPVFNASGVIILATIIFIGCTMKIYGCTLASSVNLKKCENPLESLEKLAVAVRNKRLTLGIVESHGLITSCLKNSKISKLRELGAHLDGRPEKPFRNAFKSIQESNYALVIDVLYFVTLMDDHKFSLTDVQIPKEPLFSINMAMAYGHSFIYKETFNQALGRIMSSGIFAKFRLNEVFFLVRDLARAEEERLNKIAYIGMTDSKYTIIWLFFALCFAAMLLLFEYYYVALKTTIFSDQF